MLLLDSRVIISVTMTDVKASHLSKASFLYWLLLVCMTLVVVCMTLVVLMVVHRHFKMLVLVLVLLRMMMLLDSRVIISVTITDIKASHLSKATFLYWLLLVCMTLLLW